MDINDRRQELAEVLVQTFGGKSQLMKAAEEATEYASALLRLAALLDRKGGQFSRYDRDTALTSLAEEVADLKLTLAQVPSIIKDCFNVDFVKRAKDTEVRVLDSIEARLITHGHLTPKPVKYVDD